MLVDYWPQIKKDLVLINYHVTYRVTYFGSTKIINDPATICINSKEIMTKTVAPSILNGIEKDKRRKITASIRNNLTGLLVISGTIEKPNSHNPI